MPQEIVSKRYTSLLLLGLALAGTVAFARIHLRVQTTLIGYEIGRLKDFEASLLKKRSLLTMELAKITSKQHLEDSIATKAGQPAAAPKALALQGLPK